MKITKMHALGNNYVYVNRFEERIDEDQLAPLARAVSDVRRGIGSDGLITVEPSCNATVRMRIFNADGSEAENCGNGLRCVAKYVYDRGMVSAPTFTIEVIPGIVEATVLGNVRGVDLVTIDMGSPQLGPEAVGYIGPSSLIAGDGMCIKMDVEGRALVGALVGIGNPHFVLFVDDAATAPVVSMGPVIEQHPYFPNRLNVEFVTPKSRRELDFRVWERGSGITYACGTGACASVVAGNKLGVLDDMVTVHLLGGDLEIQYVDGRVRMTGEAVEVMTGEFQWPQPR